MVQRSKWWVIGSVFLLCFSLRIFQAHAQVNLTGFKVVEENGKAIALKELFAGKDFTVLLFLGADCPLSQKAVTEASRDILKAKAGSRVNLFGLLVARDDNEDIQRLKEEFKVTFPLYPDRENLIALGLGVKVVPTAVLFNKDGRILYQGRINDRVEQLGTRVNARRHDLLEALKDALAGKPVRISKTESVGCPVENRKANPEVSGNVNYFRDIQPFLYKHCVVCHQEKGVAPFPLVSYEDATLWIETAIKLVELKVMPPGQAESHFAMNELIPNPTPGNLDVLKKWVDEGMPKGVQPAAALAIPSTDPEGEELGKPDMVLKQDMVMKLAPTGDDLYRYVVFKLNLDHELKVQKVRMVPGNKKMVHHSLVFFADSEVLNRISNDRELHDFGLQPGDHGPGYGQGAKLGKYYQTGKQSNQYHFEMIGAYTPGGGTSRVPDGYAITIPPKSDLLLQMHYHRTGKEESDSSSIELYFAKGDINPTKEYRATTINDEKFLVMPPNLKKRTHFAWPVEEDCQIVTVAPHGHFLTLTQTLTLEKPDGTRQTLMHVPRYDFNWQKPYTFREPVSVPKGSKIHVSSLMDNTSENPHNPYKPPKPVFLGENTSDEMVLPLVALIVEKDSKWDLKRALKSISSNMRMVDFLRQGFGLENQVEQPTSDKSGDGN